MSDMRKLLENMTKFAGEPAQQPGDQVRGTEQAKKKKSGDHPFQGRLVGGESIIKELEKQLVEGDVERRLREEFEQFNEFAPDSNDGGEDDVLRNYARMWWAGNEATQMQIEAVLAKLGWEIGEDEGGYDNGGVFVVRAGDVNGNSYQSWAAEDLTEGVAEGTAQDSKSWMASVEQQYPGVRFVQAKMPGAPIIALVNGKPVAQFDTKQGVGEGIFGFGTKVPTKDKVEPADDFSAKLLDRRQKQQTQAPKEKVYRGPEEYRRAKEQGVAEEQVNEFGANNPPQPTAPGTMPTATRPAGQVAPVDPKDAAALKQSLMKLKTSVPGLDVTKATNTMAKADTGTQLNPMDQKVASTIAPQLANVMKNPQMASSLKMMIDKANQQEKAADAKPPGTV